MVRSKRTKTADRGVTQHMKRQDQRLNQLQYERIQSGLVEHDKFVSAYEDKWGVERLPELVSPELREKFYQLRERLNEAIDSNDGKEVQRLVGVTKKAYDKLERVAIENGEQPLTGEHWEHPMPSGKVLAITKTHAEAGKVARDNREMVVYCLDEIANILDAKQSEIAKRVEEIKSIFPGAEVTSVTPIKKQEVFIDDEIPF